MFDFRDYGNGIFAFDSGYGRPLLAAIHAVIEEKRVAFIDSGCNASLINAQAVLKELGLDAGCVDYIVLTHIHLDHAGGAGAMMQAFPNAQLVVHPRGIRHMTDPSKLVAAVSEVYGKDYVEKVYGEIIPIPSERIIAGLDCHSLSLAGRELVFLETPGHALHHICIMDSRTKAIFSGDMFGLSYRELDVKGRQFIFPTTTPSQFDPKAMHKSIDRLLDLAPSAMYLTHYGQLSDVAQSGLDLHRHLDFLVDLAVSENASGDQRHERLKAAMAQYLLSQIRQHGCQLSDAEIIAIWQGDIELNTQGLEVWLDAE